MRKIIIMPSITAGLLMCFVASHSLELAQNGGFETGDFSGWYQQPDSLSYQSISTSNPAMGTYAAVVGIGCCPFPGEVSNNILKQSNLGAGLLAPGQIVSVSFDVRGFVSVAALFAENISERADGSVSLNETINVIGSINNNSQIWSPVSYDTVLGPDVGGGFTLQFRVSCDNPDCYADIFLDNISISAVVDSDTDGDGIADEQDNCSETANPDQIDADGDAIGNACDADFNNDCIVNASDLGVLKSVFFSVNAEADLNSDGLVNATDLGIFKSRFFIPPGPSGLSDICD